MKLETDVNAFEPEMSGADTFSQVFVHPTNKSAIKIIARRVMLHLRIKWAAKRADIATYLRNLAACSCFHLD